jgi:hypothetical protein
MRELPHAFGVEKTTPMKPDNLLAINGIVLPQEALSLFDPVGSNNSDAFNVSTKSFGDGLDTLPATNSCGALVSNVMVEPQTAPEVTSFSLDGDSLSGPAESNNLWTFATIPSWTNGISRFTAASLSAGNINAAPTPTVVTAGASAAKVIADTASMVTVTDGVTVEINGVSDQSVNFEGTTGELKLNDAGAFTGQVSGLAGSDAFDLADVSFGPNTTVTSLGNTTGGTLTVTDGTHTANVSLVDNCLSSNWDLSSNGSGG